MRALTGRLSLALATILAIAACSGGASDGTEPSTSSTAAPDPTTTEPAPDTTTSQPETTTTMAHVTPEGDQAALVEATLAAAAFQDVAMAEAAGYASTIDALGCFEDPDIGGMGLHYLNEGLMDDVVEPASPEALVYELDAGGSITGLVAHEYIVPVEAWTSEEAPSLFGVEFHQHPVLPLWVLHAWLWKDNPLGTFNDWNPAVRQCPDGVPVFGVDLP